MTLALFEPPVKANRCGMQASMGPHVFSVDDEILNATAEGREETPSRLIKASQWGHAFSAWMTRRGPFGVNARRRRGIVKASMGPRVFSVDDFLISIELAIPNSQRLMLLQWGHHAFSAWMTPVALSRGH